MLHSAINSFCYINVYHVYFQVSFLDFKLLEFWNLILFILYPSNKSNLFLRRCFRICGSIFVYHNGWRVLVVLVRRGQEWKTALKSQDGFSK